MGNAGSARTKGRAGRAARRSAWPLAIGYIVVAVAIVATSYWIWSAQAAGIRSQAEHSLKAVADLKADEITRWLNERRANAIVLASSPRLVAAANRLIRDPSNAAARTVAERRLETTRTAYHYVDVVLIDRRGRILARAPNRPGHSIGATARRLAHRAITTGRAQTSDLYLDDTGEPRLELAAPVTSAGTDSGSQAAVLLHIDPSRYLYAFIQSWPLPNSSGETLLVERRGQTVLFLNELRFRKGTALRLSAPISAEELPAAMAIRGERGIVEGLDYRGVPVFAAVRPITGTAWHIIAKLDADEVLGPITMRAWVTGLFAASLLALVGTGTLFLWRARERQMNTRLVEGERHYRTLFENMTEGVALHELVRDESGAAVDYRIIGVNPAFSAQTGIPAEQIEGRLATDAYGTKDAPYMDEYRRAAQGTPYHFETRFEPLSREFSISAVGQGGDSFATIFEDITEQVAASNEIRRLNRDLEQRVRERTAELDAANQELEAFAYSVSHDLRAPLRHVSGFSALLAERSSDELDEKSRHYLDVIARSVRQMGQLIDDLLQFSRAGRVELSIGRVDMARALEEALEPLHDQIKGRDIEWTIGELPTAIGDQALLRQVWANLVGNAVKYTKGRTPARIEIGADGDGGTHVFFVRDNGVGFDMRYADKLFGVFQRLHSDADFEGTGIGLANVKRVVTRLGGRVWAESEPGRGATFYFSLPDRKETAS